MGRFEDTATALYTFFNGFTDAYITGNVPTNATRPYLTYDFVDYQEDDALLSVIIYADSQSWNEIVTIADSIDVALSNGIVIGEPGHRIYVKKSVPYFQTLPRVQNNVQQALLNLNINVFRGEP